MKVIEIILPKTNSDKELSAPTAQKIDALKARMASYVDKILDPKTSSAGREFLKSRLRDDYHDLKGLMPSVHKISENFEVYNSKTGMKVGGPYQTASRARIARDKLDNKYGAYVHHVRPVKQATTIAEAIQRLPLTEDDFELVKELLENPIPAIISDIYISEVISDDALTDDIKSISENDPSQDVRPLIAEWLKRTMPDQMYRFSDHYKPTDRRGLLSPIHGYDPGVYHSDSEPVTGNAYGRA